MKEKQKKIFKYLSILFLIFLFIKIFFLKNLYNAQTIEDIIFFKLLSDGNFNKGLTISNNLSQKQYQFKIKYKDMNFKSINLNETINKDTLIYEKIAPGSSGSFNILLDSNQDLNYKVQFFSLNEKPKNLNFIALKNGRFIISSNTLEELSYSLSGYISKNQKIKITINWYWDYENNNQEQDIQDTKDAENIKTYKFNICTVGEEII